MEIGTKSGAHGKGPVTPVAASGAGKQKAVQPSPPAAKVKAGMGALASANIKKKAKPATSFKVHFDSPFGLKWPAVAEDVRTEVVERLSRELGEYKRIQVKKERKARKIPSQPPAPGGDATAATKSTGQVKKKRSKKAKKESHGTTTTTSTTTATAVPDAQKDAMEVEDGQHKRHTHDGAPYPANEGGRRSKRARVETEADVEARKSARETLIAKRQEVREKCAFMAVGINAVTKALENKQLEVAVVCKAFLTDVPLVPLSGDLSLQLGAIFGIRTVMAIGFKKGIEHPHADLVGFLKAKAIPLNIPWLLPAKQVCEQLALHPFQARVAEPKRTSSSTDAQPSQKQGSSKQRGRKPNA